jgi:polyhydroxybutyrate depolymerase
LKAALTLALCLGFVGVVPAGCDSDTQPGRGVVTEDAAPSNDVSPAIDADRTNDAERAADVAVTPDAALPTDAAPAPDAVASLPDTVGGDRPAVVVRPRAFEQQGKLYPLVLLLHGYGVNGNIQDAYLGVSELVDDLDFVLVRPDGTMGPNDKRFWLGTPACCDFGNQAPDDVNYLRGLVEEVSATHPIDPARVFVFGHSNGGFMSYRLACEAAETFAAIASLAGGTFATEDECQGPIAPVSVLQIHGTLDETIAYDGEIRERAPSAGYPPAAEAVARHAARSGCIPGMTAEGERFDLDTSLPGVDTTPLEHTGCPVGVGAALWTIVDGRHAPALRLEGTRRILQWLLDHPRVP